MGKKTNQKPKSNQSIWVVAGVAVIAVAALIGVSVYSSQNRPKDAAKGTGKSDAEFQAVRNIKGSPNAKVTLTEWNDYL